MPDMTRNPNDPLQPKGPHATPEAEDEVDLFGAASKELHPDSDEEFKPIQLADLEEASSELLGPPDSNADVDIEQAAREMAQRTGEGASEGSAGSGASLVSWGELVQEPQESSAVDLGAAPAVKFDALSDIDIVRKWAHEQPDAGEPAGAPAPLPFTVNEPPTRPRGPKSTQLAARGAVHTMLAPAGELVPRDEAAPVAPASKPTPPAQSAEGSGVLVKDPDKGSQFDLSSDPWVDLASISEEQGQAGGKSADESGVLVSPEDESSSVNLGSDPIVTIPQSEVPPPQKPRGAKPAKPVEDSGVLITPPDESSSVDLGSHMDINLLSSGLLGNEDESRKGLLPKGGDSAINLGMPAAETPAPVKAAKPVAAKTRPEDEDEVDFGDVDEAGSGLKAASVPDDLLGTQELRQPVSDIDWEGVPAATTATAKRPAADMAETTEPATLEMRHREEEPDAETDVEEKPAKKGAKAAKAPKQRKPRRILSGMVGALVGAGLAIGVWTVGYEPPQQWRKEVQPHVHPLLQQVGLEVPKVDSPKAKTGASNAPGQMNVQQHLKTGDAAAALDMLKNADETNAQDVVARGHARWLAYMQKEAAPNADAPEIQDAIKDLQKFKTPDAYFRLGVIYESTGKVADARTAYEEGMRAAADPKDQRKFQAALHRLELLPQAAAPAAGAQSRATTLDLALFLIALQAPAADVEDEEAGFKFIEARRAAAAGDFDTARKALAEAKARHLKRRNLHASQNPESDPLDTIFATACDELQAYMELRGILKNSGYDPKMPAADSLKLLAADKKKADDTLAMTLKDAATKLGLKDDMMKPEDIIKGLTDLADARKKADDELTTLRTELTDAKFVSDSQKDLLIGLKALVKDDKDMATGKKAAEDKLAKVATQLDAAGIKDPELDKGVDKLVTARNDLNTTVGDVVKRLETAQFLAPKADKAALLLAVDKVVLQSQQPMVAAMGNMVNNLGSVVARYRIQVQQTRKPWEMLPLWMETLRDSDRKEMVAMAALDAQRVLKDDEASADDKAEARALEGLVLRNQGKYDEARKALKAAVAVAGTPGKNFCRTEGAKILKELTDPEAFYLDRAEDFFAAGQNEDALEAADTGLDVFPNNGSLLALQAQARLAIAQKDGSKKLTAQDLAEAQKDAAAAIAAGAVAPGNYAAGRIAEAIGDVAKAEQSYREALKAHSATDAAGNTYRMALARVLLTPKRRPAPPPEAVEKVGDARRMTEFLALLVVAVQAGADLDTPPPSPEVEEALKLAEEMIKAKDYRGHLIKAQALGKKGIWTNALQEYVEGLRHLIKPEYANGLGFIVDNHPAFRRPDSLQPPDPVIGEKHFGNGLRFYFAREYPEAEKELLEAVRYNDQDARYMYYLGLSRLLQGKRETALEDFRLGARLEQQDRPSPAAVAGSLERIQGPVRQTLNKYRP